MAFAEENLVVTGIDSGSGTTVYSSSGTITVENYEVQAPKHVIMLAPSGYTIKAGTTIRAGASLSLRVSNNAPVATGQDAQTITDTAVAISLSATDADGDPLSWSVATAPGNGTLSGTPPMLSYTPTTSYVGSDSFTYEVSDGMAVVPITIDVEVYAPTGPAEIDAGDDESAYIGDNVQLSASTSVGEVVTWNPSDAGPNVTLSQGNLACVATTPNGVRATAGRQSGKYYWEFHPVAGINPNYEGIAMVGMGTDQVPLTDWFTKSAEAWGYYGYNGEKYTNETGVTFGATWLDPDVIGVLMDLDNGEISFTKNGTLQSGGPAFTGLDTTTTYYPMWSSVIGGETKGLANFGASAFVHPIPAGYQAYETQPTGPEIISWETVLAPTPVTLTNATTLSPSFTPTVAGHYTFSLIYTYAGYQVTDSVTIEVKDPLFDWLVDAGPDQTVVADTPVQLAGVNPAAWNPNDKGPGITLSAADLHTAGTQAATVRATRARNEGKWYWEFHPAAAGSSNVAMVGLATDQVPLTTWAPNGHPEAWTYYGSNGDKYNTASASFGATWGAGDVVGVLMDLDAGELSFSKNGVVQSGGPAFTGLDTSKDYYPVWSSVISADIQGTANFGDTAFVHQPAGYAPYLGGTGLAYQWTQLSGPTVTLTGPTTLTPSFTPTTPGSYEFELAISSSAGTRTDRILVDVTSNLFADAGADQTLALGPAVQLDGSASTPAGGQYAWAQRAGPAVSLSDPAVAQPSFTPAKSGTYLFALTYTDPVGYPGESSEDTVAIFATTATDTDGDGLEDSWETSQFGGLTGLADGDPDADGLSNLMEHNLGTDPQVSDRRVSSLQRNAGFDWDGYHAGPSVFTAVTDASRVQITASPGTGAPRLRAVGGRFTQATPASQVALTVIGAADAPVSFFAPHGGHFLSNDTNAVTVIADATGSAAVDLVLPSTGVHEVLATSPGSEGTVRFLVSVTE